jgi:hypothetical protein
VQAYAVPPDPSLSHFFAEILVNLPNRRFQIRNLLLNPVGKRRIEGYNRAAGEASMGFAREKFLQIKHKFFLAFGTRRSDFDM